ncbi:MAG: DUF2341 domain-containing protein [Thermodesulfobacteriota bacterium]
MRLSQSQQHGKRPRPSGTGHAAWRACALLGLAILLAWPAAALAAGGTELWRFVDTRANGQEAVAGAVDHDGNVVVTGFSQSEPNDFFTAKFKYDGTGLLWTAAGGYTDARATAVAIDSAGNVIVTGYASNGVNLDLVTVKYDGATGAVVWQNRYNAPANGTDYATAVTLDPLGNVYVAGYGQGSGGADDGLLIKYGPDGPNVDGTPIWAITGISAGSGHDRLVAVAASSDGIAVAGHTWNGADFDFLTMKYNPDGTAAWPAEVTWGSGFGSDQLEKVGLDGSGNVIVTGFARNASANDDIRTVKFSSANGTQLWQRTYATTAGSYPDVPKALAVDAAGDVYVAGSTFTATGLVDFYVARYQAADGIPVWEVPYHSGGNNTDIPSALFVDPDGDVYVTGSTHEDAANQDDWRTVKLQRDNGNLLWTKELNGAAGKNDKAVGLGLATTPAGDVRLFAGGWSDRWTAGATDYEFAAAAYDPGLLNAPTGLAATTVTSTRIDLAWTDNSSNETGFRIYRTTEPSHTYEAGDLLQTLGAGAQSYQDTTVVTGTRYYYIVKAYESAGGTESHPSNEATARALIITYDAPSWTYVYAGAGGSDDKAMNINVGADLEPVVTGSSCAAAGNPDYYTVKLDNANASVLWSHRYDDPDGEVDEACCLAVDGSNDYVVSGTSSLYSSTSGINTNDIYSFKLDVNGPPQFGSPTLWQGKYDGPSGGDDRSVSIASAVDGSNSVVLAGYGHQPATGDDIYVVKYAENPPLDGFDMAIPAWSAVYAGAGNDYPSAVAFDGNGDVIVAGETHNGTDYDIFIRKHAGTDGQILWTVIGNSHSAGGDDELNALAVDRAGNVYVAGYVTNGAQGEDFFVSKHSATDGAELWSGGKTLQGSLAGGADVAVAVAVDGTQDAEEIMVAGSLQNGAGNRDFVLVRYATDGTALWASPKVLDRPANDDQAFAMSLDNTGTVCLVGTTSNGASTDALAMKYDFEGTLLGATLYNDAANDLDAVTRVAANRYGEAYAAGFRTNAAGNYDYLVLRCLGSVVQAPAPFGATAYYNHVDFTWADNSPNETGFRLERQVGACGPANPNPWELRHQPTNPAAPDYLAYTESNLTIGDQFCYRIRTEKGVEISRWVEHQVATVEPPAPTGVTATAKSTTRVNLSWQDETLGEDSFVIERCSGAGCSDFALLAEVPAETEASIDTSACPGTLYRYRVFAKKTNLWTSAYSAIAEATTASVTAPTGLAGSVVSEGRVDLSFSDTNGNETGFHLYRCQGAGCTPSVPADLAGTITLETAPAGSSLFLHMDEAAWNGTTNEVADSSGGNRHGTASGASTAAGLYDRAGSFNGSTAAVSIPDNAGLDFGASTDFTIEAWIRASANASQQRLAGKGGDVNGTRVPGYALGTLNNALYLEIAATNLGVTSLQTVTGLAVVRDDAWHHVAAVVDRDGNASLYVDGVLDRSEPITVPGTVDNAAAFYVGKKSDDADTNNLQYFAGLADELVVYNQALTVAQVEARFHREVAIRTTQTDTPLMPGTVYRYGVTAFRTDGCGGSGWESSLSAIFQATTDDVVTTRNPGILVASRDTVEVTTDIDLGWQDRSGTEEGFAIERCTGTCGTGDPYSQIGTADANAVTYTDSTACQGTYTYRVRAFHSSAPVWTSEPSTLSTASTLSQAAPSGLTATRLTEQQVRLDWTRNTSDETGFVIERCAGAGCADFAPITPYGTTGRGVVTFTDSRLLPDTIYRYQVRAYKTGPCAWTSDPSSAAQADLAINTAGFGLSAQALNTTAVDLFWTDVTSDETGYRIERCNGTCGAGDTWTALAGAGAAANATTYSDQTVCENSTYSYRLRALDQDFAKGFDGCWTARKPVSFSSHQAGRVAEFTVTWADGMQADFDDLRFYHFFSPAQTDGEIIPHWIRTRSNGVSAVVWVKLPADNDNIFLYYGNAAATDGSAPEEVFFFYDGFAGTTIDTAKWKELDTYNTMSQNNGLQIRQVGAVRNAALIAKSGYKVDRSAGEWTVYAQGTGLTTSSYFYWAPGWGLDQEASNAYSQLAHGLQRYTSYFQAYELGVNRGYTTPARYWSPNYPYENKVVLLPTGGARYYIRGGTGGAYVYNTWTLVRDTVTPVITNSPLRPAIFADYCEADVHMFAAFAGDILELTGNTGGAEASACFALPRQWQSQPSAIVSVSTPAKAAPGPVTVTALSESELLLDLAVNTTDETGIEILRCADTGCTPNPVTDQIADLSGSLAMLLSMEENAWTGAAAEVRDSSGNGNHATAVNGATTAAGGHRGRAGTFNGVNQYLVVPHSASMNPTSGLTIEAWIRSGLATWSANASLVAKRNAYILNPLSDATKAMRLSLYVGGSWTTVSYVPPAEFDIQQWHHYAASFDGSMVRIYVDGELATSQTLVGTINADTGPVYIGSDDQADYTDRYFNGQLDQVAIHSRALSDAEVRYRYGTFKDNNLARGATYGYQVRAYKDASCPWTSSYSATAEGTTNGPQPPADIIANPVNTTRVDLGWTDTNGSNTAYVIERCAGLGCVDFAEIKRTSGDDVAYADQEVCKGTSYAYRFKAISEVYNPVFASPPGKTNFSNDNTGKWSKRQSVTIANWVASYVMRITVPFQEGMSADFADLRFYDATAQVELPYWIESKTDGVSAEVWIKTGANDATYLYFGNNRATSSSDGDAVFDFFDDFRGPVIDSSKWVEIDTASNAITQNDDLILNDVADAWSFALLSKNRFARTAGKQLWAAVGIPADTAGNNYFYVGWGLKQPVEPGSPPNSPATSYWMHGIYFTNYYFYSGDRAGSTYNSGLTYAQSTEYEVTVQLKAAGATWKRRPVGGAFTTLRDSTSYSDTDIRVAVHQHSHSARIHWLGIRPYVAATEPTVSAYGGVETAPLDWESVWSDPPVTASTPDVIAPVLDSATRYSEARIDLAWTWSDATSDETGFEIERCDGGSCSTFTVPSDITGWEDAGIFEGINWCYRLRAVKTASCAWSGPWSNQVCAASTVLAPTVLQASTQAANTTQVDLTWTDNTNSEGGFRIVRCPGTCSDTDTFTEVGTAGANQRAFSDTTVCQGSTYSYRVEAYTAGPVTGLSAGGGGTWTRRKNVTAFAPAFQASSQFQVAVAYDADMQADFDDLRFVDETAGTELPYYILEKTNGVSALIWVKTGANSVINLYYGNPLATGASSASTTLIDFSTSSFGSFATDHQNSTGFVIEAKATRSTYTPQIEFDKTGNGSERSRIDYNTSTIYRYDFNAANGTIYSASIGLAGAAEPLHMKVAVKDQSLWVYADNVQKMTAANLSYTRGTVAWTRNNSAVVYSYILVRRYVTSEPATGPAFTLGSEEVAPVRAWTSGRSNVATATTATPTAPGILTATADNESQVTLTWSDANPDESSFVVERGDASCSNWADAGTTAGPNIFTFTDTNAGAGLAHNTTYCFRVRAHKSSSCPWDGPASGTLTAYTAIPAPTGLTATTKETARIDLAWNDTAGLETGYEISRCTGDEAYCMADPDNRFDPAPVATTGPQATSFSDTTACPGNTYTYRVRAVKSGVWQSNYSLPASASTGSPVPPAGLTLTEVLNEGADQRRIDLAWTDSNLDEYGFVIERCDNTLTDCDLDVSFVLQGSVTSRDLFTAGIDAGLWSQTGIVSTQTATTPPILASDSSGTARIDAVAGAVELAVSSAGTGANDTYNESRLTWLHPEHLGQGDAEIRLDYQLKNGELTTTAQYHVHGRVYLTFPTRTDCTYGFMTVNCQQPDMAYVERIYTTGGGSKYNAVVRVKDVTTTNAVVTTDTAGTLRLTRTAGVLAASFWNGAGWTTLVTHANTLQAGTTPNGLSVSAFAERNENVSLRTAVDNLQLIAAAPWYSDTTEVAASTDYCYRVRADHPSLCAEWDDLFTATVCDLSNPAAPTGLAATTLGSRRIGLTWVDTSSDESGFVIERKVFNSTFAPVGTAAAGAQAFEDNQALDPGKTYIYRVRAYRGDPASYSAYSNQASAATDPYGEPGGDDSTCRTVP